ncbi:MAG: PAS domain S-box protein [Spongiibacteraceae bacterium]|jgi:PAS domain S-box-containing protein|nr:PAS domain S-box protein [Spongiibacteraceae bacterium]
MDNRTMTIDAAARKARGLRLKVALAGAGVGVGALATALGVSRQTVHRWLKGEGLGEQRIDDLANALGIAREWLLYGDTAQSESSPPERGLVPARGPDAGFLQREVCGDGRLDHSFRAARLVCWEMDLLTHQFGWSGDMELVFGNRAQIRSWQHIVERCLPQDRDFLLAALAALAADGTPLEALAVRIHWPDGSEHWMEVSAVLALNDAGGKRAIVGTLQHITARKLAERQLAETARLLDTVMQSLAVTLWSTDQQGHLTSIAGAALDADPGARRRLLGQSVLDLAFMRRHPTLRSALSEVLNAGASQEHLLAVNGKPTLVRMEAVQHADGGLAGCVGMALDLSDFPARRDAD